MEKTTQYTLKAHMTRHLYCVPRWHIKKVLCVFIEIYQNGKLPRFLQYRAYMFPVTVSRSVHICSNDSCPKCTYMF